MKKATYIEQIDRTASAPLSMDLTYLQGILQGICNMALYDNELTAPEFDEILKYRNKVDTAMISSHIEFNRKEV